jgi:hypothetical protein
MRLESETSTMETEQRLVEKRLAHREQVALQEGEFERRELERKSEAERLRIAAEALVQAARLDHQRELVAREEELHKAQAALATERHRHAAALAVIEDATRRQQIDTSNMEDRTLALVRQIPAALGALKVNQLNLGDISLDTLVRGLSRALDGSATG